jgi:hypothetical protein
MLGCSVGGNSANVYPIRITATYRDSSGFYIAGTTFESTARLLEVKGIGSYFVSLVNLVGSRNEGSGGGVPTINLENVTGSVIEVLVGSAQQINVTNSIVRNAGNLQVINEAFLLYASGQNTMKVDYPWGTGTSVSLLVNNGSTVSFKQVEVGEVDSAGVGYRSLRVTN